MLKCSLSASGCASGTSFVQWSSMGCLGQPTLWPDKLRGNSTSQCCHYRIWGCWRWGHAQHQSFSECHILSQFIRWQGRGPAFCPSWPVVDRELWSHQSSNFVVRQGCSDSWIYGEPSPPPKHNHIFKKFSLTKICPCLCWSIQVFAYFHEYNILLL